jgi:hypothetical protein
LSILESALRRTKWRAYTGERLEHIAELVVALADGAIESDGR